MVAKTKIDDIPAKAKYRYQVKNWAEYDRGLVSRGNLTIWFDEGNIGKNWTPPSPVGRGKPGTYSDVAIQACLTLKTLFRLSDRATEGLFNSLMRLCALGLPVPDHVHISRQAAMLALKIPRRLLAGATLVVVDFTGLRIFGEGEWKVRQNGVGKRHTWRKLNLAVDETDKDSIGIEVTTADWHDSEAFSDLLGQVDGAIGPVSADGASDTEGTLAAICQREARATILPHAMMACLGGTTTHGMTSWPKSRPMDGRAGRIAPLVCIRIGIGGVHTENSERKPLLYKKCLIVAQRSVKPQCFFCFQ